MFPRVNHWICAGPKYDQERGCGVIVNRKSVSVVIPHFNGSRWIQRALDSAYSQTRLPDEVIVVDDGSDSNEVEFLKELALRYDFKLLFQSNKGQSSARNLGVMESNSEFICLLDQDDYFLTNHIESLLNVVDSSDLNFSFSYGDLHRVSESGEILSMSCVNVKNQHPLREITVMLRDNMYILPSATLIRKEAFLAVGGFDETLRGYEDDDLFVRFFTAGFTNSFTSTPVSAWTVNPESTSYSEAMSRSRYLYFLKLFKTFVLESDKQLIDPEKVFSDLLYPRFSVNFANDVASSALWGGWHFAERVGRLKSFRSIVKSDKGIEPLDKLLYLIGTWPLVSLAPKTQALLLRLLLSVLKKVGTFNVRVLREFERIHSVPKKSFE